MTSMPDVNPGPAKSRITAVLIWLIVSQILALLSLSPWFLLAQMSTMLFDLGSSTAAVLIAGAIWGYPLLPLGCAVLAWVLYARQKRLPALIVTSLPLLVACPMSLFVWVLTMSS